MISVDFCLDAVLSFHELMFLPDRTSSSPSSSSRSRSIFPPEVIQYSFFKDFIFDSKLEFIAIHILSGHNCAAQALRPIGLSTIVRLNFSLDSLTFRLSFIDSNMNDSFRVEFHAARASIERHGAQPPFQLPWEKGIWKKVFNPHSSPISSISRSLPLPSSFSPSLSSNSSNFQSNSFPNCYHLNSFDISSVQKSTPRDLATPTVAAPLSEFWSKLFNRSDLQQGRVDGLRHLAISRFISLLASSTGSSMFMSSSDPWDLHASFSAALSMKATSTLIKRSLDLLRFKNWCNLHDKQFLPFSECVLWQFLRELQMTSKPSGPQSILQAVNFAIHVLGCQTTGPMLASVRIKGLCSGHKAMALSIKHAPPLQVDQITHLENLCCSSEDSYSRLLFGSILIALYARSRWKDLQGAHSIDCDPDDFAPQFIELPSQHFKTASMLAKKLHFLPITALVFSISGQPWIHHYIQARRDLGLPVSGKLSLPFLPAKTDANLSHEPVTSSQITKILREIFDNNSLRSHSLKHTCLSFAAKRGFDPHIRKLLGYHLDHHEVTLATYSRDLLAEPLRQLKFLLTEIQMQQFIPDATRSGYLPESISFGPTTLLDEAFPSFDSEDNQIIPDDVCDVNKSHDPDNAPLADSALSEDAQEDNDSSSTSSSGSSSSASEDEVDVVPDFPKDMGNNCFPHLEKFLPVKHRQTHRLHLLVNAEHTRLICGRALSQTYERLDQFPSHPLPTCVQCFASKIVGSFDEC